MKRKQYFITDDPKIDFRNEKGFSSYTIDTYTVFYHKDLEVTFAEYNNTYIAILGFIINPNTPEETNQQIADTLIKNTSKIALFKALELLTGRYAIFYHSKEHQLLLTDFFSERQLYHWKNSGYDYISSSDKLILDTLQLTPEINSEKEDLITSTLFLNINEHWFLSEEDWDDRIKKLIPNHYLDLQNNTAIRLPIFVSNHLKEEDVITSYTIYLQNVMKALTLRYDSIYFPITAGYDSRLLLAASIHWKDKMKYYIFNSGRTYVLRDVKIAKKVAKKFQLDFEEIKVPDLTPSFKNTFSKQFIVTRFLSKTRNIAWFQEHIKKPTINISGGGGNIKGVYNKAAFESVNAICKEIDYEGLPIHKKALDKWLQDAQPYVQKYNIPINDLFFQELRMGKWASKMYHEADITLVDYYSPLNSRHIMYMAFLNIPESRRHMPDAIFFKKIMEELLPGTTSIPFNPPTWRDLIKRIIPYQQVKKQVRLLRYKKPVNQK